MKTEKEKMIAGDLYNPADTELLQGRINARGLTRLYNQTIETDDEKPVRIKYTIFLKKTLEIAARQMAAEYHQP